MNVRWFHMLTALVLVLAISATVALAAGSPKIESTPIPKPPKPDFSSMSWLAGTWSCSVKSARRPAPYYVSAVTTMDPSGYWMITKSTSKGISWFPYPAQTTDWVTYDPATKRWEDLLTGDFGFTGATTSPGWSGNTIVWTDALFTPGLDVIAETPTTETKVSNSKWTSHTTFQERSTKRWISVDTVCNKSM
jgi:hypothetical protein